MSFFTAAPLCSKCKDAETVMTCFGCGAKLCHKDYLEHRQHLSKDAEKLIDENNSLCDELKNIDIRSSIIKKIDEWEEKSHKIITKVASQARDDAHQWLKTTRDDVEKNLVIINTEVKTKMSKENFSEFDIVIWKNRLEQLRALVQEGPSLIETQNNDQYKPLHMIKFVDQITMNKMKCSLESVKIISDVKYYPVSGSEVVSKNGARVQLRTLHHNICAMSYYEKLSMEELRLQYYSQNVVPKPALQLVSLISTMSLGSDNGSTVSTNNPSLSFIPSALSSNSSSSLNTTNPFDAIDSGSSSRKTVVKAKRRAKPV